MRWYDYVACVAFADFISAMMMSGSMFVVIPFLLFVLYADLRRLQNERNK